MAKTITAEQLSMLEEEISYDSKSFREMLHDVAGIVAEPYTAYSYYDDAGNYIGSSDYLSISDVLSEAGIEVVTDG